MVGHATLFFEIRYDGYDGSYRFQLMEHLKLGILELIPLTKTDLLGASICHRLSVGDSEEWFKGKVLGILPGSNPENPEFSVEYGENSSDDDCDNEDEASDEEDKIEGSHVEDYPLLEDYLNGDLGLL